MTTARTVVWQALQWTGLEYFTLTAISEGFLAEGQLVGVYEDGPYNMHYRLHIDTQWHIREVLIHANKATKAKVHLTADGRGQWYNQNGLMLPELAGCIDVDLTLSPFTNTLPIRRLRFLPKKPQRIMVVYLDLPTERIRSVEQLYTQLTTDCYQFHQPALSFSADLSIDADGLVIDYPNLFRRVY